MYSCGPLHMDKQRQDDQLEPIYNCSVPIQDIALKTFREQWMIETGGEKGSGRYVLAVQHYDGNEKSNFYGNHKFLELFARYGLPDEIISDNASQFTAGEFRRFCETFTIKHFTTPAYHPPK